MSRYIDADALKYYGNHIGDEYEDRYHDAQWVYRSQIDTAPSIEPNLILPEQMGRGDIYEVGETIVVMNHDDYYDLLCNRVIYGSINRFTSIALTAVQICARRVSDDKPHKCGRTITKRT